MLWPEWLVLSQLVLCWVPCLESIQCSEDGGDGSALCTGMFGDILPKLSSKHPPELQENLGAWCARSPVSGKILIRGKENSVGRNRTGQTSHTTHQFVAHTLPAQQLCVYPPSPLCLLPRPHSSGSDLCLLMETSPLSCWQHQPCPARLLTRLFFLHLLPMDFYFRAVC